jgi:hypothetical protein
MPFGINTMGYDVKSEPLDIAWASLRERWLIIELSGDYWKSPAEFVQDDGGDCEDYAARLIYLLGRDASFVGIKTVRGLHAIVEYKGQYIDPMVYGKYYNREDIEIVCKYNYDLIMLFVTRAGTTGI